MIFGVNFRIVGFFQLAPIVYLWNIRIVVLFFHREDDLVRLAKGHACDIVCFGHTHRSYIEKRKGVFLLNPGSTWMSRDGNPPSYAILDVDTSISAQIVFLDQ